MRAGNFLPLSSYALSDAPRYLIVVSKTLAFAQVNSFDTNETLARKLHSPHEICRVGDAVVYLAGEIDSFFEKILGNIHRQHEDAKYHR